MNKNREKGPFVEVNYKAPGRHISILSMTGMKIVYF
jgi:hypothetical protein